MTITNEQKQIILSGIVGDGYLQFSSKATHNVSMTFTSIHKEYLEYKASFLGDLGYSITSTMNKGFKKNIIHKLRVFSDERLTNMSYKYNLKFLLTELDELGIAMWFYDDGALHKTKHFYNLSTHGFSEEEHIKYIIPFFKKNSMFPKLRVERKKDGRILHYLSFNKYSGADKISSILQKYYVNCFNYKIWSSETIQKWSKLQEQLKSEGKDIYTEHVNSLGNKWRKLSL